MGQHPFRGDIEDRVGGPPINIEEMEERAVEVVGALWFAWHQVTFDLLRLGLAPRELCDATNRVATIKDEIGEKAAT